jgi:hypothetical protein
MENNTPGSLTLNRFLSNGWTVGGVVFGILALNVAGRLQVGVQGVLILTIVFIFVGFTTFYWLNASLSLLARIMRSQAVLPDREMEIMNGLWPLILLGPATSLYRWLPLLGSVFTLLILLTTLGTLTQETRQIYQMSLPQAVFSIVTTMILGLLAAAGIFVWPFIFFLGIGQTI